MILDKKLIRIFEGHEKEDEILLGPYLRETLLGDFEEGEAVLEQYRGTKPLDDQQSQIPTRIEHEFSIRKHTTLVEAYYHTHNYYEMILVLQGNCTHYIQGEGAPMILETGSMCLLVPGTIHAMEASKENDLIVKTRIPIPLFLSAAKTMGLGLPGGQINEQRLICCQCTEQCLQLWQMLFQAHLAERDRSEGVLQSYLVLILKELLKEPQTENGHEAIEQIILYIRKNMKTANLSKCAVSLGYSNGYLSRLIREQTGETFRELLLKTRLQKAVDMLTATSEPIEEIGRSLGYKSAAGFYKCFSKVYGMTPGEYKKMFS